MSRTKFKDLSIGEMIIALLLIIPVMLAIYFVFWKVYQIVISILAPTSEAAWATLEYWPFCFLQIVLVVFIKIVKGSKS